MKSSHKERAEKVRSYASKNIVFIVAAILIVVFLIVSGVSNRSQESDAAEQSAVSTEVADSKTEQGWRFYPIDLVVLGVGGGFCSIMIIRERRKAKEGLQ